ncbi:hypothetical protein PRO82_000486 [Candidatus Protochlamydia amoebophila]|nr:hypothetical protein [Candidatus Protochlamydia amoebophila]
MCLSGDLCYFKSITISSFYNSTKFCRYGLHPIIAKI